MQRSETKKETQQRKKQSRCVENPLRNASSRIRLWKTTTQPKSRCCEISHYLTNVEKKFPKPKVLCPPRTNTLLNCFCVCLCVSRSFAHIQILTLLLSLCLSFFLRNRQILKLGILLQKS
jgi:hypothetical protein